MPINPNILLQGQVADIGKAVGQGLEAYRQAQEGALSQQKFQQAQFEADLLKGGVAASRLKPFITSKDYTGFKTQLQREGLDQEDMDMLDTYARANRWDELGGIADQFIQTARDSGVFQRDYAAAGAGGYTPSAVQLFEYRKKLVEQGDEAALREFDNIVKTSQIVPGGGETRYARNPITGKTELIDVTGGTGGTGAGGPKLTRKDLPPGANVILDKSRSGREGLTTDEFADYLLSQGEEDWANFIRNLGKGTASEGGAVTPDKLSIPQPSGGPATQAEMEQPVGDSAEVIKRRERELAAAKKTGELDAKEIADLRNQVNATRSNIARFEGRFKKQGVDILQTLKDAPQTGLSGVFSRYSSFFINGLSSERAQAKLEPLFQDLVRIQPFPPGAQSQPELEARQKAVGDILSNGRLTPEDKLEMLTDYFDGINAEAREKWAILNETRVENGLPRVATPYDEGKPFGIPKVPGTGATGATGGGNIQKALDFIRKGKQ